MTMIRLTLAALATGAVLQAQNNLPPVPVPPQNPITPAKTILGKLLFWEEQMSSNNRVACGTCHTFSAGGGDLRRARHPGLDGVFQTADDVFGSPGVHRADTQNSYLDDAAFGHTEQVTRRASPSMLTAAWFPELFWDGRARTTFVDPQTGQTSVPAGGALESQAIGPILDGTEMAHDGRTWSQAVSKLATAVPMALATNLPPDMAAAVQGGATYPDLFQNAFGTPAITAERIAFALATYQRTLVPNQTPFDLGTLTAAQARGLQVFRGPGRCVICHTDQNGLFSDRTFRNLGLRPINEDRGRQEVTNNFQDRGRFKVPSLRNVGLRRSFMHNGQFTAVADVVDFYRLGGGAFTPNKDPQLQPLNLPPPARADLIEFVENGLTDPRVAAGAAPFDRPTLRSDVLPPNGVLYGAGTAGTGGISPTMLAGVPANLGHADFKVGIGDAQGAAIAALLISPLQGLSFASGATLFVDPGSSAVSFRLLAGAPGAAGAGCATAHFPLPSDPALASLVAHTQWVVFDSGSFGGLAATAAATVTLF